MDYLTQSLYKSMLKHTDAVAFDFDGERFTYSQLLDRVSALQAALLSNTNIAKSFGIIANQDFDTYTAIVSALLSGITYIPIEPTHPDERNNHIVRISKINIIFCSDRSSVSAEFYELNKNKFTQIPVLKPDNKVIHVIPSSNPAYILFTSGSTGIPKGVPISIANLQAFSENVACIWPDISEHSKFLQVFELTFDLSVFSFLIPLLHGATIFILPKTQFKQMAAVQLIESQGITYVLTVPSFVGFLKPLFAKIKLPSVQNWLFCGEALKADLVSAWQTCIPGAAIYNVYGPTEATIFCTSFHCHIANLKHYNGIVSIGKPFNDTVFGLFDGDSPVNEFNTAAELGISGSQLTSGYLDDQAKNKASFFESDGQIYYRSGDLCRIDSQGDYYFTGRNDSQVKVNGYRVEISELEYHAACFPGIIEAVVIATTNPNNDQQVLNLVYSAKSEADKEEITLFLATKIPAYMLPAGIQFVENIPYNLNGKIDKRALAERISNSIH